MICTEYDDFVPESHWIAVLSDGVKVLQDDYRYGTDDSAWLRLKQHCEANNLWISHIILKFRSHEELIPPAEAYWFTKSAAGFWGNTRSFEQLGIGRLNNGVVTIDYWVIPELILMDTSERSVEKCLDRLIRGPIHQSILQDE